MNPKEMHPARNGSKQQNNHLKIMLYYMLHKQSCSYYNNVNASQAQNGLDPKIK